jgi:hypothetical protein
MILFNTYENVGIDDSESNFYLCLDQSKGTEHGQA